MVARYFDPDLAITEEQALEHFGVDGFGPRCFVIDTSFIKAALSVGLVARTAASDRQKLGAHLAAGPVVLYHRASGAADALPHFSVAVGATDSHIVRHDPGIGENVVDTWEAFEPLWDAAKVRWWPEDGRYVAALRPKA